MAMFLLVLWITAATTVALSNAQEPAISERERRGLATCLTKCPDGDMKCNSRCIPNFKPGAPGAIVRAPALGIVGTDITEPRRRRPRGYLVARSTVCLDRNTRRGDPDPS
jgi:hypothetical protein